MRFIATPLVHVYTYKLSLCIQFITCNMLTKGNHVVTSDKTYLSCWSPPGPKYLQEEVQVPVPVLLGLIWTLGSPWRPIEMSC